MSHVFEPAITKIVNGTIALATHDIRVLLVSTATTADTEFEAEFLSSFTSLDEVSATNYVRKAVTGEAINQDLTNNRAEFDFADVTWTALGGAANDTIQGAVVFRFVTNDADSPAICFLDNAGASFNLTTNGSDVVLQPSAEGVIQFTRS